VVKGDLSGLKKPILKIDARKEAAVSGQPLLSLGYATGISAILARRGRRCRERNCQEHGRKNRQRLSTSFSAVNSSGPSYSGPYRRRSSGQDCLRCADHFRWLGWAAHHRDGEVIGVTFAVVKGFGARILVFPFALPSRSSSHEGPFCFMLRHGAETASSVVTWNQGSPACPHPRDRHLSDRRSAGVAGPSSRLRCSRS